MFATKGLDTRAFEIAQSVKYKNKCNGKLRIKNYRCWETFVIFSTFEPKFDEKRRLMITTELPVKEKHLISLLSTCLRVLQQSKARIIIVSLSQTIQQNVSWQAGTFSKETHKFYLPK